MKQPAELPTETAAPHSRSLIGLLAALPLLLLMWYYVANIAIAHDLGAIVDMMLIMAFAIIAWIVSVVIELRIRKKLASDVYRAPWFTIIALPFLLVAPFMGPLVRPVVLQVPSWCRTTQSIFWEVTEPGGRDLSNNSFALVFIAIGNHTDHRFVSGYLNWTGDEPAGYSIDLERQVFEYWQEYDHFSTPMQESVLRERIGQSGLDPDTVNRIASESWQAIQSAQASRSITANSGQVSPLEVTPMNHEDEILGAWIWVALVVGTFQYVAWYSLPKPGGTHQL